MHVVATAGHVDHGKSTLIRALTGMEPDRWAQERRRGMTIDLGFAWTRLPSQRQVAFVDVPGHERFLANMLAGVGAVPAVMFVVAADEGWMPQSAEHLAALDALGVRHGLLVVTRCDLADAGRALAQARSELAGTTLGGIEAVTVSGTTGEGMDGLRRALDRLVGGLPAPDDDADARLWIDRAFTIRGAGTVVTGTLGAGTLRVGDSLTLAPAMRPVVIRGLQCLGEPVAEVTGVSRVAVNLRGLPVDEVARGHALLTPGRWLTTDEIDVRLTGILANDLPASGQLHVGSAQLPVRVRPLGADTARLALSGPLPLRIGDRALLRDPGLHRIAAGVTILDARPPALRRRGAAAARARELAGQDGRPDGAAELRQRLVMRSAELVAMGATPPADPIVDDWLIEPSHLSALRRQLRALVSEHAADRPLEAGLPIEAARRRLGLPDARLVPPLVAAPLALLDGRVCQGGPSLPAPVARAVAALQDELGADPYAAPAPARLAELSLGRRELAAVVRAGALARVAEDVYLLPESLADVDRRLAALPQPFTVSEAREALRTSRRVAVPLLELLDAQGRTQRLPDNRRRLSP